MQFSPRADNEDMFQSILAAVRGQRQPQHSGCGGHNNYTCTNLRQSVEIVETCLLIRGRLTLCTQYISSPLRIHQPLPSRRLSESIIAGHQATVAALFHSKHAFEPVRPIHQVGGSGIYMTNNTERRRYGTCVLVLALFHPGGSGSLTICLGLQTLMCQGMIKHIQMPAFARASPVSH